MSSTSPHLIVAFTSNSLTSVDVDFIRARHLVLYKVWPTSADFLDAVTFSPMMTGLGKSQSGCPAATEAPGLADAAATRIGWLDGVGMLFTAGLSDHTAMRLSRTATFPVVVERRRDILDIIDRLQALIRNDPPLWLCRLLRYRARPMCGPRPWSASHDGH